MVKEIQEFYRLCVNVVLAKSSTAGLMASSEEASRPFAGLADVSISEEIPVEGDITVPACTSIKEDEFSTLDEPVKETILRDLRAVGNKFIHVLYPKRSSALLRDWDLWGPLLLCVTLALLLQGGAADSDDQGGPQFAEVTKLLLTSNAVINPLK